MGLIRRVGCQAVTACLLSVLWSAQLDAQTPVPVSAEVRVDSSVAVEFGQLTANAQVRAALEAIAAGVRVYGTAGGKVTDADGDIAPLHSGTVLASSLELHPLILETLKGAR